MIKIKKYALTILLILLSPIFLGYNSDDDVAVISRRNVGTTEYTVYITDNTSDFNGVTYSAITALTGVEDNRLVETASTTNYGSHFYIEVTKYGSGSHTHGLIKFPTSSISATATVTAVELGVYCYEGSASTRTFKITRVLRNWVEDESTWTIYSTGNSWTTGGALSSGNDIHSSAAVSTIDMDATAWSTTTAAGLVSLVQDWVDGTSSNYGLHFERDDGADDSTYNRFGTHEYTDGYRPYLKVVYED